MFYSEKGIFFVVITYKYKKYIFSFLKQILSEKYAKLSRENYFRKLFYFVYFPHILILQVFLHGERDIKGYVSFKLKKTKSILKRPRQVFVFLNSRIVLKAREIFCTEKKITVTQFKVSSSLCFYFNANLLKICKKMKNNVLHICWGCLHISVMILTFFVI